MDSSQEHLHAQQQYLSAVQAQCQQQMQALHDLACQQLQVQQQQLAQVAGAVTTGMAEVLAQVLAVVPMRWCALTSRSGGRKNRSCSCL